MNSFSQEQDRIYAALKVSAGESFFLRRAKESDALWVCDLPRHKDDLRCEEGALTSLGVSGRLDDRARLWFLDWTPERYGGLVGGLSATFPAFPRDDALHPAYALCRLLLTHPAPFHSQPLSPLRRMLKLCAGEAGALLRAVEGIHMECAGRLGKGLPLPHAAGLVLAEWLRKEGDVR